MAFSYYDHKNKRYWMSVGNTRSCRDISLQIEAKKTDAKVLEEFLTRNAVSVTTPKENTFKPENEQNFPAEQRAALPGVPPTELVEEAAENMETTASPPRQAPEPPRPAPIQPLHKKP